MKRKNQSGQVILLIIVVVMVSVAVLGASIRILPDAPEFPTPTYPKGIDFPDERPVPRR